MANLGNMYGPKFTFLGIGECDLDDPKTYQGHTHQFQEM